MNEKIKVIKNGPLIAYNIENFYDECGEKIETKSVMSLCRCGHSKTKPFCDGTHGKESFDDAKIEPRCPDRIDIYEGKEITVYDNRAVCSHPGYCTDMLPEVFHSGQINWIFPDKGKVEDIIKVCEVCPSGALSYKLTGEKNIINRPPDDEKKITIGRGYNRYDGPFEVSGGIELDDPEGNKPDSVEHYALCRCGHSKNKPFCDGRHRKFRDGIKVK